MKMFNFKKSAFTKSIVIASSAGLIVGCIHEEDEMACVMEAAPHYAVVSTQSDDGTSSDISLISLNSYSTCNSNYGGLSDTVISTDGENIYRIGRFEQDTITKLHIDSPNADGLLWQFSANGEEEASSNPYKLVVKDENTAYLIRYGQSTIWIVNPSVDKDATAEEFKIGEIDLSSYTTGESDTTPEAADALLIDNKLYVMLQNLDANWAPGTAYIAVFDTENDNVEIETNTDSNTPKGIELEVTNPSKMEYVSTSNTLYISGVGAYGKSWTDPVTPPDFAGGIEAIDLDDYSNEIVVHDGEPYGQTTNIAILSPSRGYFVGYSAWQDTAVYSFNPTTGEVDAMPLVENMDISDIEIGPLGNLWITNRNESGVTIYDTVDNSVFKALIDTDLKPNDIEFVSMADE